MLSIIRKRHESHASLARFSGKIVVFKLSGKTIEDPLMMNKVAGHVAALMRVGCGVIVVHGGGSQITKVAAQLGVQQQMVAGRRITDAGTLEVVKMVLAGKVNLDVTAGLSRHGLKAVGFSGLDGTTVLARKRAPLAVMHEESGEKVTVDFGLVGEIVKIDTGLIDALVHGGFVPVIASLGTDGEGEIFNINADTVAAEVAMAVQAEKIVFCSDVEGIYQDSGDAKSRLPLVTRSQLENLIASGIAGGGMLPKLSSIGKLLHGGVKSAHIVGPSGIEFLLTDMLGISCWGTLIS
jgi:acetylglutamate kinase